MRVSFDSFITIDAGGSDSDPAYIQSVRSSLQFIRDSQTGKVLLDGMRATGKRLTIAPYHPIKNLGTCNAYASSSDEKKANVKGEYILDDKGKIQTETSVLKELLGLPGEPVIGLGGGSASTIAFTPGLFWKAGLCQATGAINSPGFRPSEVLFHEMVHAYRQMRGICYSMRTVGGRTNYDNLEEFAAVVISDIYISETRGSQEPLRADHATSSPPLSENTSSTFLAIPGNRNLIKMLKDRDPTFFKKLGGVSADFNPFTATTVTVSVGRPDYITKTGDTLSDLAAKFYGAQEYWPLIWWANQDTVLNPNLIKPGRPLRITPLSSLSRAQLEDAKRTHASWKNYPHGPKPSAPAKPTKVPVAPPR